MSQDGPHNCATSVLWKADNDGTLLHDQVPHTSYRQHIANPSYLVLPQRVYNAFAIRYSLIPAKHYSKKRVRKEGISVFEQVDACQ